MFHNRVDAGVQLAARLAGYADRDDVRVVGIPRGGITVAFQVAQALYGPGGGRQIPMNAQEKVRVNQQPFERELNSGVKATFFVPSLVEKFEQRLKVLLGHGPAIGEPGHSG